MESELKLRCQLKGHDDDVRAVTTCGELIVTSSRDKTIKTWREHPDASIGEESTLVGHSDYVVALAPMLPGMSPDVPGLGLVSGSRDTNVVVWDLETGSQVQTLSGHKYQVSAVGILPGGEVASGGLDGVVKVWKGGKCIRTLEGHAGAILCLIVLPNGDILSGSGDKTIKQWSGSHAHSQYTGHTDSVRGLCLLPDLGFVSASHDATLKVWTFTGEVMATLAGHSSLVYCCAATTSGLIASGSEDNTMRVWNVSGDCLQTIPHPGSVWSVAFLISNDLISGCSDSNAYLWTCKAERQADADAQAAYGAVLQDKAAADADNGTSGGDNGIPEDQISDASTLLVPGAKDNETKIVRKDGKLWAYAWTAESLEWSVLGEVTGGPGNDDSNVSAPQKWYQGQEWDFLFDVDVADGTPHLKLPMNRGEDVYDVADRFILTNGLPVSYREQIVSFVLQNAGNACASNSAGATSDPFTGSGAYVPSNQPAANVDFSGAFPDPFSGSGAYVPSSSTAAAIPNRGLDSNVTGGGCDPFTGSTSAAGVASAAMGRLLYAPHKEYQFFDAKPPVDKLRTKLLEFSEALSPEYQLTADEAAPGTGALAQVLAFTSTSPQVELLSKLARWPAEQLFPVLDLFRILILDLRNAASCADGSLDPTDTALGGMLARGLSKNAPVPTQMLALRTACNCCKHSVLRSWLFGDADRLLDAAAELCASDNKNVRTALATLLLNFSVSVTSGGAADVADCRIRVLSMLTEVLATAPEAEHDCQFRALLAAATIAYGNQDAVEMGSDLGISDHAVTIGNRAGIPEKLKVVAGDVKLVFQ